MTFQIVVLPQRSVDITGQIAATSLLPISRIAPSGAELVLQYEEMLPYEGIWWTYPVMNEWSDVTFIDIASSAAEMAAINAVVMEWLLESIPCVFERHQSGMKAGQYARVVTDKAAIGTIHLGRALRQTMQGQRSYRCYFKCISKDKTFRNRYSQSTIQIYTRQSTISPITRGQNKEYHCKNILTWKPKIGDYA